MALIPKHVAIIMDGNGRWAEKNLLPRAAGHKKGAEIVSDVVELCIKKGIPYLTLYAFSSENWHRSAFEVNNLMSLLRYYLNAKIDILHKKNVRFLAIGDLSNLPEDITQEIDRGVNLTSNNTAITLNIAISYGARSEILMAAKNLYNKIAEENKDIELMTESDFASYLYTKDLPEPDLLIRTGGEKRLSNFLLWQLAYTELFFTETLWPEFSLKDLEEAIIDFQRRDRRYGRTADRPEYRN